MDFENPLVEEFDEIYVFNLRGDAMGRGERRRKEGGNVFGHSTRTPVSIIFFLKNPGEKRKQANIFYSEIGDYLSRKEKLEEVHLAQSYKKIKGRKIIPDKFGDWINQRDDSFFDFLPMGNGKK